MSVFSKSSITACLMTLAIGCGSENPQLDTFTGTYIGAHHVGGQGFYHGNGYQNGSYAADWYSNYQYNPYNYQNIVVGMTIQYQQDYLDAMKMKAEAALIKAKAKAELNEAKAEAIREATEELRRELAELRNAIAKIEYQKRLAHTHAHNLTQLSQKGQASADVLTSIHFMMNTIGMPTALLGELPAPAAASADLRSLGAYRVETDAQGRKVFREAKVEAFGGGSMLQLLHHMKEKRVAVKLGSSAHKSLLGLSAMMQEHTNQWLAALKEEQDALRAKMDGRWEQLLKSISKIQAS